MEIDPKRVLYSKIFCAEGKMLLATTQDNEFSVLECAVTLFRLKFISEKQIQIDINICCDSLIMDWSDGHVRRWVMWLAQGKHCLVCSDVPFNISMEFNFQWTVLWAHPMCLMHQFSNARAKQFVHVNLSTIKAIRSSALFRLLSLFTCGRTIDSNMEMCNKNQKFKVHAPSNVYGDSSGQNRL